MTETLWPTEQNLQTCLRCGHRITDCQDVVLLQRGQFLGERPLRETTKYVGEIWHEECFLTLLNRIGRKEIEDGKNHTMG